MAEEKKLRKGFETGGKIFSPEEWERLDLYWLSKTPLERIEAVTFLIHQYIKMYNLPDKIDVTVYGKRYAD